MKVKTILGFVIVSISAAYSQTQTCKDFKSFQKCIYNETASPQKVKDEIDLCAIKSGCSVPNLRKNYDIKKHPKTVAYDTWMKDDPFRKAAKCTNMLLFPPIVNTLEDCIQKKFPDFIFPQNYLMIGAKNSSFFDHRFNDEYVMCPNKNRDDFKKCIHSSKLLKDKNDLCEAERSCFEKEDSCTVKDLKILVCQCAKTELIKIADIIGSSLRRCMSVESEEHEKIGNQFSNEDIANTLISNICQMGELCEHNDKKEKVKGDVLDEASKKDEGKKMVDVQHNNQKENVKGEDANKIAKENKIKKNVNVEQNDQNRNAKGENGNKTATGNEDKENVDVEHKEQNGKTNGKNWNVVEEEDHDMKTVDSGGVHGEKFV